MRRFNLFSFIIAAIYGVALAAPQIEFLLTHYNFGNVKQGERAVYDFKFFNRGTDTLIISDVRASCGCTASNSSKKSLAPGDSAQINISFNSTNFSGNVQKSVTVRSNDPKNSVVTLQIVGNVQVDFVVQPKNVYIYLGETDEKQPVATKRIDITNQSAKPGKILSMKSTSPVVNLKINPAKFPLVVAPNVTQTIEVEVAVFGLEKSWKKLGDVEITTDSKLNPSFTVGVFMATH